MEWEEALRQAERTGGTIDWSEEKGYFVAPQYRARPTGWMERGAYAWPWQTVTGEGFMAPWGDWYTTPTGEFTRYRHGMPQLSWPAQYQLQQVGYQEPLPEWLRTIPPTPEQLATAQEQEAQGAMEALGLGGLGMGERFVRLEPMDGYLVPVYADDEGNEFMDWEGAQPTREMPEAGLTDWQRAQLGLERAQLGLEREATEEGRRRWEEEQEQAKRQFNWQQEQWQQQLELARQQHLAELATQPMSWLQYAAESETTPVVQPWMLPLMPQEYGHLQTGQPVPGYKGTEGMAEMPALTAPSTQYWARMGPTAQAQYMGYKRARTGQRPEETGFRRWSMTPPSGRFAGLSYKR